jgi:uncharacterized membrane protein YcaP (DUF421 family)
MELIKDFLIVTGRILTILPLMLIVTLFMGKRSIGELPVFDFLVIITLGSVVGADIAEPNIPHIHTAVAIVLIGIFQIVVAKSIIKHRKFGHIITFEPTIVIQDGQFIVKNLKKIRYSIDNILQMLREKEIFDVSDVRLGIVESNGVLSILKKESKALITVEDMNIAKKSPSLSYPVIIDGKVYIEVLVKLELTESWLKQQLLNLNINNVEEVFFASVNTNKELQVSPKSFMKDDKKIMPLYY